MFHVLPRYLFDRSTDLGIGANILPTVLLLQQYCYYHSKGVSHSRGEDSGAIVKLAFLPFLLL